MSGFSPDAVMLQLHFQVDVVIGIFRQVTEIRDMDRTVFTRLTVRQSELLFRNRHPVFEDDITQVEMMHIQE